MVSYFRILLILTTSVLHFNCGSSDKLKSEKSAEGDPSIELTPVETSKERPLVYLNNLAFDAFNFEIEVLYQVDETSMIYSEWVKIKNNEINSFYTFSYDYSNVMPAAYSINTDKEFWEDIDNTDFASTTALADSHLKNRFKTQITKFDYLSKKESFQDTDNYEVIKKVFSSCQDHFDKSRLNLKNHIVNSFQNCRSSEYYDQAYKMAKGFYFQNATFAYRNLFGLMRVAPRLNTYLEIDYQQGKLVSLGTAISPNKPFRSWFLPSAEFSTNQCSGEVIYNPTNQFSKEQALFLGATEQPLSEDFGYFIDWCMKEKKQNWSKIEQLISESYPDSSDIFKESVSTFVYYGRGFTPASDAFISEELDKEINKAKLVINDDENAYLETIRIFHESDEPKFSLNYHFAVNPSTIARSLRDSAFAVPELNSDSDEVFVQEILNSIKNLSEEF